jgi:hypothetical protein
MKKKLSQTKLMATKRLKPNQRKNQTRLKKSKNQNQKRRCRKMAVMDDAAKLAALKIRCKKEYDDALLQSYLDEAAEMILNRENHPKRAEREVFPQYAMFQVNLAKILVNMRGVEGQTKHTENSITRDWDVKQILDRITPYGRVL